MQKITAHRKDFRNIKHSKDYVVIQAFNANNRNAVEAWHSGKTVCWVHGKSKDQASFIRNKGKRVQIPHALSKQ